MGISESFSNLFKTKQEREREIRRRQRRAFTKAEDAIDTVNSAINELTKDKLKSWDDAKKAASIGQKAAAMLSLQKFRAIEVQIYQLEKRKWVFQNYLTRLKMLDVNNVFAEAMEAINQVVTVDVDAIADAMDNIDEKLLDGAELDRMWEKNFEKNLNGMSVKETDIIPDVDSLFNSLQGEVALDIGGAKDVTTKTKASINDVQAKMDAILNESSEK